jgi:hypothetical protein
VSESTVLIALVVLVFFFGYTVGSKLKMLLIQSQDWMILKWDKEVFGFRPARPNSTLIKGDRVIMALEFDTSNIPEEGLTLNDDSKILP